MISSNLCIPIIAEDCEASDTSLDNLWSEVVPVITQKISKIPLCIKLIPFDVGAPNAEETPEKMTVSIPNCCANAISSLSLFFAKLFLFIGKHH